MAVCLLPELAHGIMPIFKHYVANVVSLHSILVFVSFRSLPVSITRKVPLPKGILRASGYESVTTVIFGG